MEIEQTLAKAPAQMARLAMLAEDSRFLWDESKIKLKQVEAKKHLSVKATEPNLTVSDLKAKVDEDSDIYEQRLTVIGHESEFKKNCIEFDKWENAFTSARKLANLKIEEMRANIRS